MIQPKIQSLLKPYPSGATGFLPRSQSRNPAVVRHGSRTTKVLKRAPQQTKTRQRTSRPFPRFNPRWRSGASGHFLALSLSCLLAPEWLPTID